MAFDWAQLFPDADYRFSMGLRKGDAAAFYAPTAQHASILAERCRWIEEAPAEHVALEADGCDLLDEVIELAIQWRTIAWDDETHTGSSEQRCAVLAQQWEPDFLLLRPGRDGMFQLVGGSVCFPSSWSLREKMGRPLPEIHGVVPGLNAMLERQIQTFLARLAPGVSWERENWGLSRTPEWNMHPRRALPRLQGPLKLDEVWLRVEHQSFIALPKSRGILFGIRLSVDALAQIRQNRDIARGLSRALQTMPEAMAHYKGLAEVRTELIQLLV